METLKGTMPLSILYTFSLCICMRHIQHAHNSHLQSCLRVRVHVHVHVDVPCHVMCMCATLHSSSFACNTGTPRLSG